MTGVQVGNLALKPCFLHRGFRQIVGCEPSATSVFVAQPFLVDVAAPVRLGRAQPALVVEGVPVLVDAGGQPVVRSEPGPACVCGVQPTPIERHDTTVGLFGEDVHG